MDRTCDKVSAERKAMTSRARFALYAGFVIVLAGLGFDAPAAKAQSTAAEAELAALVQAAKAEGEVTLYSAASENVAKDVTQAFSAKYGIKAQYLRLSSNALRQRYATEAQAGNVAGDLLIMSPSAAFTDEGIAKGWIEPVSGAGIPALKSGAFPSRFATGPTAIVQLIPWSIGYNTDKVKGADLPKDWTDLLNPKFKSQIVLVDVAASDAYLDVWALILEKHGEQFFSRIRAQSPRVVGEGSSASQSVAAGEGFFVLPATPQQVNVFRDKGAPIATIVPDLTTGVEISLYLTHRAKAKHPNAARLFAHYMLTPEGNAALNKGAGNISVFDTAQLPKQYQSPKPETAAEKDRIKKLLGL